MIKLKQFDKRLFEKNDKMARDLMKSYLSQYFLIKDNEDKYGPDLVIMNEDDSDRIYIEVEIKQNWNSVKFPFSTVNIPFRKKKYLESGNVIFYIISKDFTQAIIVHGINLKEEYLTEVPNKYILEGELFYQIPINICEILQLKRET